MSSPQVDWLTGSGRRAAARERIRAAAAELFSAHGVDGVSVADIAARAGCSRATLYRHCGGKDELVRAVMAASAARVAERVRAQVSELRGTRRIVEAVIASIAAIRADPALSRWLSTVRSGSADDYLATSPELERIALALTGVAADEQTAQWIVRVVLSLLVWPLPDRAAERHLVERFLAPSITTPTTTASKTGLPSTKY